MNRLRTFVEGGWFGRERAIGYARMMAIAFAPSLVFYYLQAMGPVGSDFLAFWSAGRMVVSGDPAAAYDPAAMEALQTGLGRSTWFPFLNPPPFLAVVAPLGLVPYAWAWPAWVAATYAVWLAVARRIMPGAFWPVAVFPGALIAAWHGQNGFVTGALFIGAMLGLRSSRPWLAGALIGALVIKPHLVLLAPVALAASRNWKAFIAAAISALGLLLVSWLAFGPDVMAAFLSGSSISAGHLGDTRADFLLRMPTVYASASLFLGTTAGMAVQAVATLACAVAVWRVWATSDDHLGRAAVLATAAILATPYAFHYDLPLLILPVCWWARDAMARGWAPYERPLLAAFYWSPLVVRAAALPLGVNVMPLVLGGALVFMVRRVLASAAVRPAGAIVEGA
ncbi:glycosyltransferase family 87 protein [Phenylobacterium sp.]|uniref:glycosyltransferase family 87 protein n=1 Tax=Phenylobacterium sp. TaxID=1871053 RepID=UPI002ED7BCF4